MESQLFVHGWFPWLAQSEYDVGRKMSNTGWLYLHDFTSY